MSAAYVNWPFASFAVAAGGLMVPALLLDNSNPRIARRYVALVLLFVVMFQARRVERFARFAIGFSRVR